MKKRARCMADGGMVDPRPMLLASGVAETPDQLLARMNAKYGLGGSGTASTTRQQTTSAVPSPAPPSQPAPTQPSPSVTIGGVVDSMRRRNDELKKAATLAAGGIVRALKGQSKSPTADSVPIMASHGEAVLPAKTVAALGGPSVVEKIIEETNGKPPASGDDNEVEDGMAYGIRKMAAGGVIDSEEDRKRRMTNYVVPTPAPTAREVYGAPPLRKMFDSLPEGGLLRPENRGSVDWNKGLAGDRGVVGPKSADLPAVAQPALQEPSPDQTSIPGVIRQGNAFSQAAITPADSQITAQSSPATATQQPIAAPPATTGNAGDARFNAANGVLSFTDKSFDPTKQQFAPGSGAITGANGRTMVLTGTDYPAASNSPASQAAQGISGGAFAPPAGGPVDAYGNSTALTTQLQGELARAQADNAAARAKQVSTTSDSNTPMFRSPGEEASSRRFDQFVRESNADRIAHDLGTGGGSASSNAGKIAALQAIQSGVQSSNRDATHLEAMRLSGQNRLYDTALRGQNQLADIGASGANQLAVTNAHGKNLQALESARQNSPDTLLKRQQTQGEIDSMKAQQQARNALVTAESSGDQALINQARINAIAQGVLKPEKQEKAPSPYRFHSDPMGNGVRVNEATGATDVLDRATNTWKPVSAIDPAPLEPANRKAGQTYQTPSGPMIWRGTGWEPVQAR